MPVTLRRTRPLTLHLGCRPHVAALTRRQLLGASAACLVLHATGCRSNPPESASQQESRQVATDKGTITVPNRAERVVCADFYGAFAVVDLGLTPVGAAGEGYDNTGDRYAPPLADVPSVGDFTEPDLEKVAAQRPDLILRTIDTDDKLYEQLQSIAPTAVISFQQLSLTDVAVRVGDVLGRADAATELEQQYRGLCDRIRTDHTAVLAERVFAIPYGATSLGTGIELAERLDTVLGEITA